MKAYVSTTGVLFALIVVAHVLRVADEGLQLATNPGYLLLTGVAAAMAIWAWRLLRLMPR
jgi:hypothetical protein